MPRHVAILNLLLVATNVLSAPFLQDDGLGLEWNFHASGMNDEDTASDTEPNSPQKQQVRETTNQLDDLYETEHYFNGFGQKPVLETEKNAIEFGRNQRKTQESKSAVKSNLVTPTTTLPKNITGSVESHRSVVVRQDPESTQLLEGKQFSDDEVNLPNSRRMFSRNPSLSTMQLAKFSDSSTSESDDPSLDLNSELSLGKHLAAKDSSSQEKENAALDTGPEVRDLLMTFHDPIPMVAGDTIEEANIEHVGVPINPYLVKRDLQNSVVLRWINADRFDKSGGVTEDAFDWGGPRSENVSEDNGVHMFSNYYKELVRKYKNHRNDSLDHQKTHDPRLFQELNPDAEWNKLQIEQNNHNLKSNLTDEHHLFNQYFTDALRNRVKDHQNSEESFYPENTMDEFPESLHQNFYPEEYKTPGDDHMLPQYSEQGLELPAGKGDLDLPYSEGNQFAGNVAEENTALSDNQFRKYTLGLRSQGIVPPNYWFEEPRVDPYRNPLYKKLNVNRNMINDPEFLKKLEKYRDQKRRKMTERERQRNTIKTQMWERQRRLKQQREKVLQNMEEQRNKQGRRKGIESTKLLEERKPLMNIFHKIFPPRE